IGSRPPPYPAPPPPTSWCSLVRVLVCSVYFFNRSQEEHWYLEILEKGKVACPTCKAVIRKTVEGLKKHMINCKEEPYECQHCGKQLKSLAGLKYHLMADHNNMPILKDGDELDEQSDRDRLRKVLKRMGRLKCLHEACAASFTSIMGYLYHLKKCGKEESELVKQLFKCQHCGKLYKSKAGLDYHLKSEHAPSPETTDDETAEKESEPEVERTSSGRVRRSSAKLAAYHLHEIVADELAREWPRRKIQRDLVPDDDKLKYTRPGLPTFSHEVLRKWKNEMKAYKRVQCPNKGEYVAGKYKCLICEKEFSSESGVKYHINNVHSQVNHFHINYRIKIKTVLSILIGHSLRGYLWDIAVHTGCRISPTKIQSIL
uniref:Zinc finger protein 512 n=1 Tax=Callorhinchus milii TaxID=7868 RepID=A0A4W3JW58_CALMI